MRFYVTEQLSHRQSLTPEGFLLCEDVPIARVGEMLYAPGEIPVTPGQDGLIRVMREEKEVFHADTITSFLGKPVTNDHPPVMVSPDNWRAYAIGNIQNVHRGEGALSDLLLADFLITDRAGIAAVRSGKREVSCGYDAQYLEIEPGRGRQSTIIGNHVALVEKGRCGARCAIGDQDMTVAATAVKPNAWKDRLARAMICDSEAEAQKILEETGSMSNLPGSGNVHIHLSAAGVNGPVAGEDKRATKDEKEDKVDEKEEPWKKSMDGLSSRMDGMENGLKEIKDAVKGLGRDKRRSDEDPEKEEDDEKKEKKEKKEETDDKRGTKDSSELATIWTDTIARAEILSPGIMKLPTFDAALPRQDSVASLCAYRRTALTMAASQPKGKAAIDPFLGTVSLHRMTCDRVKQVFLSASEVMKVTNNAATTTKAPARAVETGGGAEVTYLDSPAAINAAQAAFWAKK